MATANRNAKIHFIKTRVMQRDTLPTISDFACSAMGVARRR